MREFFAKEKNPLEIFSYEQTRIILKRIEKSESIYNFIEILQKNYD